MQLRTSFTSNFPRIGDRVSTRVAATAFLTTAFAIMLFSFSKAPSSGNAHEHPVSLMLEPVVIYTDDTIEADLSEIVASVESLGAGNGEYPITVNIADDSFDIPEFAQLALNSKGGFWLSIGVNDSRILAADLEGVANGLSTFARQVKSGSVTTGDIVDHPQLNIRALHIVLRGISLSELQRIIYLARSARFNTLVVQLADGVQFSTLHALAREDALTREEFQTFIDSAASNGLQVVPEVKLLTHQEKFLKNAYPEEMFNSQTYDPRSLLVRELVHSYLEEVIQLANPSAIHIGHDEVRLGSNVGHPRGLKRGEQALPPELFELSVRNLHSFLADRNVETWIWGDMLIAKEEVPEMDGRTLHGTPEYAKLRTILPRDIVICDWQYYELANFSSSRMLSDLGFRVVGASWRRPGVAESFSRSVADLPNGVGMMATTWYEVQRRNWEVVERIILDSGNAFWGSK